MAGPSMRRQSRAGLVGKGEVNLEAPFERLRPFVSTLVRELVDRLSPVADPSSRTARFRLARCLTREICQVGHFAYMAWNDASKWLDRAHRNQDVPRGGGPGWPVPLGCFRSCTNICRHFAYVFFGT